jgi:hypothetical protein
MKSLALGTVFRMENPATTGFLTVGNLTSVGVPSPEKPTVDVTDFDSTAVETLAGLPDNGVLPLSGFFNYANPGQQAMLDDAHDPDAPVRSFQIDFERQDVRFEFDGQVLSFQPTAGGPNEAYTFDASVSVSGGVTITSPIPA